MHMVKRMVWVLFGAIALSGCASPESATRTEEFDVSNRTVEPSDSVSSVASASPVNNTVTARKMYTSQPAMSIDKKKSYTAKLKTSVGDIVIALDAASTPITVNNFVFLAKDHFYDGTIFHRTIKDFMIQGGDPQGTGMGGPGYRFDDEPFNGEYVRGTVAMANAGSNTNGSQFFIMHKDVPLPKNYVIFGHVISGLETIDAIATAPVKMSASGEQSSPVTPVTIETIEITEQ